VSGQADYGKYEASACRIRSAVAVSFALHLFTIRYLAKSALWKALHKAEDKPMDCLLERLLCFGTRLSSGDGAKVSIGHFSDIRHRQFSVDFLSAHQGPTNAAKRLASCGIGTPPHRAMTGTRCER